MASEHSSLRRHDRAGDVAVLDDPRRFPTRQQSVTRACRRRRRRRRDRRPPRPGAAARSWCRRDVATITPSPPILTMANCTPRASSRRAASGGSADPTATSHSVRLPTATVTWSRTGLMSALAVVAARPEVGAVVEVEHDVGLAVPDRQQLPTGLARRSVARTTRRSATGPGHRRPPADRSPRPPPSGRGRSGTGTSRAADPPADPSPRRPAASASTDG